MKEKYILWNPPFNNSPKELKLRLNDKNGKFIGYACKICGLTVLTNNKSASGLSVSGCIGHHMTTKHPEKCLIVWL